MNALVFPKDFMFAGHSLGEYAAITAVTGCVDIASLLDVMFMRGMTMQSVVERDSSGKSDFGMMAVDPTRVAKGFNHVTLAGLIKTIEESLGGLLQIVNYNVDPTQYVVAGDLVALHALMHACNALKASKEAPDFKQVAQAAAEQAKDNKEKK